MISLPLAKQLKEAGLAWTPARNDFFAIPDRGMDDRIFVITDMFVDAEVLYGQPIVAFHGSAEWALDYMMIIDVVWLPTEAQLRETLERRLPTAPETQQPPVLRLARMAAGYLCEIQFGSQTLSFEAPDASEAYAAALLHLLATARPARD